MGALHPSPVVLPRKLQPSLLHFPDHRNLLPTLPASPHACDFHKQPSWVFSTQHKQPGVMSLSVWTATPAKRGHTRTEEGDSRTDRPAQCMDTLGPMRNCYIVKKRNKYSSICSFAHSFIQQKLIKYQPSSRLCPIINGTRVHTIKMKPRELWRGMCTPMYIDRFSCSCL